MSKEQRYHKKQYEQLNAEFAEQLPAAPLPELPGHRGYKVRTMYNRTLRDQVLELNTMPSETIPDQSMSVEEIVRRFASGMPLNGGEPLFADDDDSEDLDSVEGYNLATLDLSELAELKQKAEKFMVEFKAKADLKAKEERQAKHDAEIASKADELLKSREEAKAKEAKKE